MVSLQEYSSGSYSHTCGASILTSRFLLGAAHCFKTNGTPTNGVIAVVGSNNNDCSTLSNCNYVKVKTIHQHPSYDDITTTNDIAIFELDSDLTLDGSTIKRISVEGAAIPNSGSFNVVVAGWGTVVTGQSLPTDLRKVTIPVVDVSVCTSGPLNLANVFFPKQICAGGGDGKDSCTGDSGGKFC